MDPTCSRCHVVLRTTDYYCYNCGLAVREAPPRLDFVSLLGLFGASLMLPPMGLIWGYKYLKFSGASRYVGIACYVLTIIELIVITMSTISLMKYIESQVNSGVENMMSF